MTETNIGPEHIQKAIDTVSSDTSSPTPMTPEEKAKLNKTESKLRHAYDKNLSRLKNKVFSPEEILASPVDSETAKTMQMAQRLRKGIQKP